MNQHCWLRELLKPIQDDNEVTFLELQEAYNDVHEEFVPLCKAYKVLKTKKESLESKVDSLSEELAEARKLLVVDGKGSPQHLRAALVAAQSQLK